MPYSIQLPLGHASLTLEDVHPWPMATFNSRIEATALLQNGDSIDLSPHVKAYSDQHALEGIPTFTLLLPARIGSKDITQLVDNGDLIHVALQSKGANANPGPRFGQKITTMVGVVRKVALRQMVTEDSLEHVCQIAGTSLTGFLANDQINYYMSLGNLVGAFRALGITPVDQLNHVSIAAALAAFTKGPAFKTLRVERPQGNIEELLGFAYASVAGEGLFSAQVANYEGSFLSMLEYLAERPIHELYHAIMPREDFDQLPGEKHSPRGFGSDEAVSALVMRPAPFPHSEEGSSVDFSAWDALPLHDISDVDLPLGQTSGQLTAQDHLTDKGDGEIVNFCMLTPVQLTLDVGHVIAEVPPVMHDLEWRRFGYRPLSFRTNLWGSNAVKENAFAYFRRLNWRMATQHTKMANYFEGVLTLPLMPNIKPGHRLKVPNVLLSQEKFVYYVTGLGNTYTIEETGGQRTTTVMLERGLPESLYRSSVYFTEGLAELNPYGDDLLPEVDVRRFDEPGPTLFE